MSKQVLVLLSGGLDSAVLATYLTKVYQKGDIVAVTFDYGQKNAAEIDYAIRQCRFLGISDHRLIEITPIFDGYESKSALLTPKVPIPHGLPQFRDGIPETYVPGRNLVFLSSAITMALALEIPHIYVAFISANDSTNSNFRGYPDAGIEFLGLMQEVVFSLGSVILQAPFADFTKTQVVRLGLDLGAPFHLSLSCFDPHHVVRTDEALACGNCDACTARLAAFDSVGAPDPAPYYVP